LEPIVAAKIRVLLIEDNRFLREGITDILRSHGGFVVDARGDDSTGRLEELRPPTSFSWTSAWKKRTV
jgi:hypothetical protein